ncbi:DUF7285 family protein [Halorientalis pallida]|uniref:DUF7285 family protein n=1 Tax=Halorientalis pallida TaxID=2479928 RepID=UPI003C703809
MSRSSTGDRGQTEPLAALVAVSVMALGLALYGGYLSDVLPGNSDRHVEGATQDRVWNEIQTNGVFDESTDIETVLVAGSTGSNEATDLPEGYNVYVAVTRVGDDGRTEVVDSHYFASDSSPAGDTPSDGVPDAANNATRPVPVRESPGDVEGGRLVVSVWT